jgi:hypothetical protein
MKLEVICVCEVGSLSNSEYGGDMDFLSMLSGSLVTAAWHVLTLQIEETASRYGG